MCKEELASKIRWNDRGLLLCGLVGKGATAQVYRVKSREDGAEYACKISRNTSWLSLESGLLRSIEHPLFPAWKDYWEEEGIGCIVMEYIAGTSLENFLKRRGKLFQNEGIRIALELAEGLGYLHEHIGVIYRDLKPANIMLQQDGSVRLLDLGAAAVPQGWKAGTPGYAAPEQNIMPFSAAQPRAVLQQASDVYGLGMVMHYMLSGRNPLLCRGECGAVREYSPEIYLGIDDIISRCLTAQPEERIQGMRELLKELSPYYNGSKLQIARQELKTLVGKHRRQKIFYQKNIWASDYKNIISRNL